MVSRGCLHVPGIIVGVDTHKDEHVAVVVNNLGVRIGQRNLPTTNTGYVGLEHWASSLGEIDAFGVAGPGSYGAGRARFLRGRGHRVIEVNRPDRSARRRLGKSNPLMPRWGYQICAGRYPWPKSANSSYQTVAFNEGAIHNKKVFRTNRFVSIPSW